ncbi:MAG: hypothetical protein GEU82_08880 [Luteitalea sp.]|nr:hypothetical protein [Luteitalea sp.]
MDADRGADAYAIGVWNEVDTLGVPVVKEPVQCRQVVWRQHHTPTSSIDRPDEVSLEPGTYFWSVAALLGDWHVAESGLAAFVVRTAP